MRPALLLIDLQQDYLDARMLRPAKGELIDQTRLLSESSDGFQRDRQ